MPSKTTSLSTLAPALQEREFEQFRKLAYEKFGLNLTGAKQDLVASRLGKKLRELRLPSFRAYYDLVVSDKTGESLAAMIDALSTITRFFCVKPRILITCGRFFFPRFANARASTCGARRVPRARSPTP